MKLLKKLACGLISAAVMLSCCANIGFAADETGTGEAEIPTEKKTIYNFTCKESGMSASRVATISETPVSYYSGYTESFLVSSNTFAGFDRGTLLIRDKGAANGGEGGTTYALSAYGNNGELYDGQDGRDYWMSFDITTGATIYMVDRETMGWPSKPDDWDKVGTIGGESVFAKHFDAGEKVNIPCYGWDETWDKTKQRLFMNPAYFVIAWDNDATLENLTYTIDGSKSAVVSGFNPVDEGGAYEVDLEYKADGWDITVAAATTDPQASATASPAASVKLTYDAAQSVEYTVTSEAGDETLTYTVNFNMLEKKEAEIAVSSELSGFGANESITDIYQSEHYAGYTSSADVTIAHNDENGDLISEVYTINKGEDFFTDGASFGMTGSAFDKAVHILTSSQLAPGNVSAASFDAGDETTAEEFKAWLCDDENYMYTMTPNHDSVIYVAFTQSAAENHAGFTKDGWNFNDYSGVAIPDEALLDEFKAYTSPEWWMTDSAYNYNGNAYLIIKNQYNTDTPTTSEAYYYIWSKVVKEGETVSIPVGGSAFSDTTDKSAPKVLINWQSQELRDDVSGAIMCGERRILIDDSLNSRTLPTMVAEFGDELSFAANFGATAKFSQEAITILPCVIDVTITSEAGSKVVYTLSFKEQPQITSVNVSPIRDKFVSNTGSGKIELSPYLAGELTEASVSIQTFEEDEFGVLQPVYGEDGGYVFETKTMTVGRPFYRDRSQHKFIHVGEGFKNMQYFWIPSNDATTRRRKVYTDENKNYAAANGGAEKTWEFVNEDGTTEYLNYTEISNKYEEYVLGDNEYFNFTANGSGVVYAVLENESPNFSVLNGWKKMTVEVPLPEGHAGWRSVAADVSNPYYPYQVGKVQYDGHATEYHIFDVIYYKPFNAEEVVSIPTTGVAGADVMAVMVGWEDFISDDAGGVLTYGDNRLRIRNDKEKYTVHVYEDSDMSLSFAPAYEYARVEFSDYTVKLAELPKTVTLDVTNAFGVKWSFEIEFVEGDLGERKVFNFDTVSDYTIYESENGDAYNTNKGFIKFSEGWYMLEENLELGVSSYYSDRLTHKFTAANTSAMFAGATYVRRPKKSADYGNFGLSYASKFYTDELYNGKDGNASWLSFGISSAADVYVGVPGDGAWPNKPDGWQEVEDESIKLAGCTKVYVKSYSRGDNVEIPSMGWSEDWTVDRTSWDLPVYVIVWQ